MLRLLPVIAAFAIRSCGASTPQSKLDHGAVYPCTILVARLPRFSCQVIPPPGSRLQRATPLSGPGKLCRRRPWIKLGAQATRSPAYICSFRHTAPAGFSHETPAKARVIVCFLFAPVRRVLRNTPQPPASMGGMASMVRSLSSHSSSTHPPCRSCLQGGRPSLQGGLRAGLGVGFAGRAGRAGAAVVGRVTVV